jgi:hypothetical protein
VIDGPSSSTSDVPSCSSRAAICAALPVIASGVLSGRVAQQLDELEAPAAPSQRP